MSFESRSNSPDGKEQIEPIFERERSIAEAEDPGRTLAAQYRRFLSNAETASTDLPETLRGDFDHLKRAGILADHIERRAAAYGELEASLYDFARELSEKSDGDLNAIISELQAHELATAVTMRRFLIEHRDEIREGLGLPPARIDPQLLYILTELNSNDTPAVAEFVNIHRDMFATTEQLRLATLERLKRQAMPRRA